MSFIKSVMFGSEGSYSFFGIQTTFEKSTPADFSNDFRGASLISYAANVCINSQVFRYTTQGYLHVFVHEMGHALSYKLLTGKNSIIRIFQKTCTGTTQHSIPLYRFPKWKVTIIGVTGPIGNIAFSTCKLLAAIAFKNFLTLPIAVTLGVGSVIWISGELLYAFTSAINKDSGDFHQISYMGKPYLALASAALISQAALSIFVAIKLAF